jgi:hypothetical protein
MPRPGTKVIPVNWSGHHRPVAEGGMTAAVELRRPSSGKTFDESGGKSVYTTPAVLWSGVARVQRISRRGGDKLVGDRFAIVQMYQVSLPADVPEAQIDDQIYVAAAADDPKLIGKLMRVREVRLGSLIWERDLICEEPTPTTR